MERINHKKVILFILFILIPYYFGNAELLTDIPAGHWAREAIERLSKEGVIECFPDGSFRGNEIVTRYELAVALYRLLDRIETLEILLSEGAPAAAEKVSAKDEDKDKKLIKEDIKKLVKELKPELGALMGDEFKKIEKQLKELEKIEKEVKELKKTTSKDIKILQRDIKSMDTKVTSIMREQTRLSWTGSGKFTLENRDFFEKGLPADKEFLMNDEGTGTVSKEDARAIGTAPPSVFVAKDEYSLLFKAQPKFRVKTDKRIELSIGFAGGRDLGQIRKDKDTPEYDWTRPGWGVKEDFYFEYSAPRSRFMNLRLGRASAGWSLLSLSMLGYPYEGLFLKGLATPKLTLDFVASRLKKAKEPTTEGKRGEFAEYLYGLSLSTSYAGQNLLRISYLKHFDDKDSIKVREAHRDNYTPTETQIADVITEYRLTPDIGLSAELSYSWYKEWQKAPYVYVEEKKWGKREEVPIKREDDLCLLLGTNYNKRGLTLSNIFLRQNPDYHNPVGGIMGMMASIGGEAGGLALGGIDLGVFLTGGVNVNVVNIQYTPIWAKGLSTRTFIVYLTEVLPTKLSGLLKELEKSGIDTKGMVLDADLDKRDNKLYAIVLFPQITYKPTIKTLLTLNCVYAKFAIPKDVVEGIWEEISEDGTVTIRGSAYSIVVNPPNPLRDLSDTTYATNPTYLRPFFEYQNTLGQKVTGVIYPDKVDFYLSDNVRVGSEIKTEYVNLFRGEQLYLDIEGGTTIGAYGNLYFPYAGRYVYAKETAATNPALYRITEKPIELEGTTIMPSFKLIHEFTPKLKYEIEGKTTKVDFKTLTLPGTPSVELIGLLQSQAIKTTKKTSLNQHIIYELFHNITLDFYYNINWFDYYEQLGGHQEKSIISRFTVTMNF